MRKKKTASRRRAKALPLDRVFFESLIETYTQDLDASAHGDDSASAFERAIGDLGAYHLEQTIGTAHQNVEGESKVQLAQRRLLGLAREYLDSKNITALAVVMYRLGRLDFLDSLLQQSRSSHDANAAKRSKADVRNMPYMKEARARLKANPDLKTGTCAEKIDRFFREENRLGRWTPTIPCLNTLRKIVDAARQECKSAGSA